MPHSIDLTSDHVGGFHTNYLSIFLFSSPPNYMIHTHTTNVVNCLYNFIKKEGSCEIHCRTMKFNPQF
jgi:hypothetical protein